MTSGVRVVALLTGDPLFEPPLDVGDGALAVRRFEWSPEADVTHVVDELFRRDVHAVCVGPSVPAPVALEIAKVIDRDRPDVGLVLLDVPSPELWQEAARVGVRDIIDPAAVATELLPALRAAIERSERVREAQVRSTEIGGKVIVVLSPKGGSGKTMVASNVSAILAISMTGTAVLVDLDCVFGDVSGVLSLLPTHTIGELATLPALDSTTLKVFLGRHERSGLYVLAASGRPEEGDAVSGELTARIIDLLRPDFDYVVTDTAAGLDDRALAAIERATDLVLLATMDSASIRNLSREIHTLDRLGLSHARRHFVLNRADSRVGLEVHDVENAIGLPVVASLSSSRLVPLSMNQGEPLVLADPSSPVARQLVALAQRFVPVAATSEPVATVGRGRRSFRRR